MKKKKKDHTNKKREVIFGILIVLSLIATIFLSFVVSPGNNNAYPHINHIGVAEFRSSYNVDVTSIIYFGNGEIDESNEELKVLDDVAKEYDLMIEYVNVAELVPQEKEELKTIESSFNGDCYPNLIIIKEGKTVNNSNVYLNRDEILDLFKKYEIID